MVSSLILGWENMSGEKNHAILTIGIAETDASESVYHEKTFSDSSYFGLVRNKLPWVSSGTSRYKDTNVSHSTVISAAIYVPPSVGDSEHDTATSGLEKRNTLLFTVSVNHTLKVWSLERGNLIHACDLLNEPPTNSHIKTILHPAPTQLMALIKTPMSHDHLFYLVTFSPAANGSFKFWIGYRDNEGRFSGLDDMYPSRVFDAMPPTANSVWIISDFTITPVSESETGIYNMWILWKSNTSFKIQNLQFHLNNIPEAWSHWATSTVDSLHTFPGKMPASPPFGDVTERWTEWIFYPERFPESVIEAALEVYEQHFSRALNIRTNKSMTIKARVGKIVASAVEFQRSKDGGVNMEKYKHEVSLQWDRFVRICVELDRQRGEALSLVADPVMGYIWAVNADGLTALRECTETEMIIHNQVASKDMYQLLTDRTPASLGASMEVGGLNDAIQIIRAAGDLMSAFAPEDMEQCIRTMKEEILSDPILAVIDRMWNLLERCITGRVPKHVLDKIDNTFAMLENPGNTIRAILSSIHSPSLKSGSATLTEFGARVLTKGTQEVINMNHIVLFNLAFLVTIATFPNEGQDKGISNGEEIFSQVVSYLREYEILKWMAGKSMPIQGHPTPEEALTTSVSGLRISEAADAEALVESGSVLQLMLPEDLPSAFYSITASIRNFIGRLELTSEMGVLSVASSLLTADATGLACEFSDLNFLPRTYWGSYVKGRALLRGGHHGKAAVLFERAATGLGYPMSQEPHAAMRDVIGESELSSFGNGMPQYYIHIAKLFEDSEHWGHVARFCRAALYTLREKVREWCYIDAWSYILTGMT